MALALTEAILRRLGATPEQIDRERERVRLDLVRGHDGAYSRDADASPQPLIPQPPDGQPADGPAGAAEGVVDTPPVPRP